MYLARIEVDNFRLFGSRADGRHCEVVFQPGLNLLVGENDSGKTCLIDAIRLLTGTATAEYFSVAEEDFHVEGGRRATQLKIVGEFRGLDEPEAGALLEYLSIDKTSARPEFFLRMWLLASLNDRPGVSARKWRVETEFRAGMDEEGRRVETPARQLLRATYMKPLRDAVTELAAKKGSRLSQVLRAYPEISVQASSDWTPGDPLSSPTTLVGIMRKTEDDLRKNAVIQSAEADLNTKYLGQFSLGDAPLLAQISVRAQELQDVLERLELSLADVAANTSRGLGIYNLLFMATELLALTPGDEPELPLVLIEEPEAHLHPQLQIRLVEFLRDRSKREHTSPGGEMQIVMSSHSPNLASKVGLKHMVLMSGGQAYPMGPQYTTLEESDYQFLERFLDVTKANLFFARGVLIVEGDAEMLLLPTLAERIGRPLSKSGVSIVNVGHMGLFRYARIFQRQDGKEMSTRVGCVTDRDIPPTEAGHYLSADSRSETSWKAAEIAQRLASRKKNDGGPVQTFVSPCWTLEHDLALSGLAQEVHMAVSLAVRGKKDDCIPSGAERLQCLRACIREFQEWAKAGKSPAEIAAEVYRPLYERRASKTVTAQCLAQLLARTRSEDFRSLLPKYLVEAIDYVTRAPDTSRAAGVDTAEIAAHGNT